MKYPFEDMYDFERWSTNLLIFISFLFFSGIFLIYVDFENPLSDFLSTYFLDQIINEGTSGTGDSDYNLVNTFSINTPQFIIEIDYLKEEINDYIEKGIFPSFDVDLFALVIRPITDSLAQEMMSQKKIDINKYTEKCINFLTRGLGV